MEFALLVSAVGAAQSLFLALFLSVPKDIRLQANLCLAGFFLAVAIRVTKSLLWAYLDATPLWVLNLGFAAHLVLGPLLWMYIRAARVQGLSVVTAVHFFPAIVVILGATQLPLTEFWYRGAYHVLLVLHLAYVAIAGMELIRHREEWADTIGWRFAVGLALGSAVFGLAYVSNFMLGWTSYLAGPVLYSAVAYALSFYAFRNQRMFRRLAADKYRNLRLSDADRERVANKLRRLMEIDKVYLSPDLTLTRLAELAATSPYVLSAVLSQNLRQSFPEFVNTHRIRESQHLLAEDARKNEKVASIAFACGYNSLSAFNAAFRKATGITPSEYRSRTIKESGR